MKDKTRNDLTTVEDKGQQNCAEEAMNHHLKVRFNVDTSLTSWTDNCFYRCKRNNSQEKRNLITPVYCEVLGNDTCTECTRTTKTLLSVNSSLAEYPKLETGSYLLFLTMDEKLQKATKGSPPLSRSVQRGSGYSSQLVSRCSPSVSDRPYSRSRVRSASVVASELHRLRTETPEKSSRPSSSQALSPRIFSPRDMSPRVSSSLSRPSTSNTVSNDTNSPTGQRVPSSRLSMRNAGRRRISPLSQEGWSVKQIEAWKLLAPTPPQIEVSQMNVSMYTPKELPGIKIFDESFFVI